VQRHRIIFTYSLSYSFTKRGIGQKGDVVWLER